MNDKLQKIDSQQITPMSLIADAQTKDVDIEKMQQLFDLQLRWEKNEAVKAYNEAISQFRAECPLILKTKEAYSSKYAGLAETIEQIKHLLSKHGLSHSWRTKQDGSNISVSCKMTHRLGHSESTELTAGPDKSGSKNSIQAIGSTVSYLERYTLFAILGIASTDQDDDGNAAQHIDYITESQARDINALLTELKVSESGFLNYLGYESIETIPSTQYNRAMNALEKKREQNENS
jgi:hypothetical protein